VAIAGAVITPFAGTTRASPDEKRLQLRKFAHRLASVIAPKQCLRENGRLFQIHFFLSQEISDAKPS
jgi:hypothetical protein